MQRRIFISVKMWKNEKKERIGKDKNEIQSKIKKEEQPAAQLWKKADDPAGFSKEIIRVLERAGNRGASAKSLQEQAGIRRHQTEAFFLVLAGMVKSGAIQQKRGRYYKAARDKPPKRL